MDLIYLRDIELQITIGLFEWEKQIRQKLYLSLEMGVDLSPVAQADSLTGGVDYGMVLQRIQHQAENAGVQLLETLAEQIAALVLKEFPVKQVKVDLAKQFIFPNVARTGVVITRKKA